MLTLGLVLCLTVVGAITEGFDEKDKENVRGFMDKLTECSSVPGNTIVLVKNGEVVMAEGFGLANIEMEEAVNADSKFAIASISKQFTTVLLATVFEKYGNGINWDTKLNEVLDEPMYFSDGYRTNNIVLRDLVSHKSGLTRNDLPVVMGAQTREQILSRVQYYTEQLPFRSSFFYNNNMFIVASLVVEKLTGQTYEAAMRQEILEPLSMNSTGFYHEGASDGYERLVMPYTRDLVGGNPDNLVPIGYEYWNVIKPAAPAGGMVSTARDMGTWLQFLLAGGVTQTGMRLISEQALNDLFVPQMALPIYGTNIKPNFPESYPDTAYSSGFFTGFRSGYRSVSHGGVLYGYHSLVSFLPDTNVGTFVSFNANTHTAEYDLATIFLTNILMFGTSWLDSETACSILDGINGNGDGGVGSNYEGIKETMDMFQNEGKKNRGRENRNEEFKHFENAIKQNTAIGLSANDLNEYASSQLLGKPVPNNILIKVQNLQDSLKKSPKGLDKKSYYAGQYGNFVLGNVTIYEDELGGLEMDYGSYGRWHLEPITDRLFAGYNRIFMLYFINVRFNGDGNKAQSISSPSFDTYLAVFERDLTMDQAPQPNEGC